MAALNDKGIDSFNEAPEVLYANPVYNGRPRLALVLVVFVLAINPILTPILILGHPLNLGAGRVGNIAQETEKRAYFPILLLIGKNRLRYSGTNRELKRALRYSCHKLLYSKTYREAANNLRAPIVSTIDYGSLEGGR